MAEYYDDLSFVAAAFNAHSQGSRQRLARYTRYVTTTSVSVGPPILKAVFKKSSLSASSKDPLVELLAVSLVALEGVKRVESGQAVPSDVEDLPGFDEFDGPDKTFDLFGLTKAQMQRVWIRRIAVILWADANLHWPWSLDSLTLSQKRLLLGFSPIRFDSWDEFWSKINLTGVGKTKDSPLNPYHINGQYLFFDEPGATSPNPLLTPIYHFKEVWDPNPLVSWRIAFDFVRPLLTAQGGAPDDHAARKDALTSMSEALFRRGHQHYNTSLQFQAAPKIWPDYNDYWPPQPPNPVGIAYSTKSLRSVWNGRLGGCQETSILVTSVLRAMGVPARVTQGPTYSNNFLKLNDKKQPLAVSYHAHESRPVGAGISGGHLAVNCPSPKGTMALLHGDDICSYRGNRWGDSSLVWIDFKAWLFILDTGGAAINDSAYKSGNKSPQNEALYKTYDAALGMLDDYGAGRQRTNVVGMGFKADAFPFSDWLDTTREGLALPKLAKPLKAGTGSWRERAKPVLDDLIAMRVSIALAFHLGYVPSDDAVIAWASKNQGQHAAVDKLFGDISDLARDLFWYDVRENPGGVAGESVVDTIYSKAIVQAAGPAFFKTGLGGTWGLARMPLNWVDSQHTTKGIGQEVAVLQGVVRFARKIAAGAS